MIEDTFTFVFDIRMFSKRDRMIPWSNNIWVSLSWLQEYKNRKMARRLIKRSYSTLDYILREINRL